MANGEPDAAPPESPAAAVEEPDTLTCPISLMLFRDPVITFGGRTYDRDALEEFWKRRGEPIEPLSNSRLPDRTVITNYDMRAQVETFLAQHPGYVPRGWNDRSLEPARAPVQNVVLREI